MKVAFLNRDHFHSHPGGDILAINDTMAALQELGIDAQYIHQPTPRWLVGFDLAHLYHLNFEWSHDNAKVADDAGKPWVMTPVFYPAYNLGLDQRAMIELAAKARVMIPFSQREKEEMDFHGIKAREWAIVPNGTSPAFHAPDDAASRTGVITVAARGTDKGCKVVEKICAELGIPYKHISGFSRDAMPAIYRRAKLFVNLSDSERMSLTIGEALCAGCRVLATSENQGNGWYPELRQVNPWSPLLKEEIALAYHAAEWNCRPNHAARKLTWKLVASMLRTIYAEVLR